VPAEGDGRTSVEAARDEAATVDGAPSAHEVAGALGEGSPPSAHEAPARGASLVDGPEPESAEPEPEEAEGGASESRESEPEKLVVGRTPGVRADDTLAEAGRKVLRFHFAKMLAKEAGTRTGKDAEDLHSMRVATRRMRAAWRVFGEAYRPRRQRRYVRDLRDIAARLGGVRDLDVLIEELEGYVGRQAEGERANLAPLVDAWRHQREDARALLVRTLDAEAYRRFVDEYREFVRTEGLGLLPIGPSEPHRVRDRMPTQIWAAYEQVRAYEPILRWADVETLHTLRIAAKRLRYTIEFAREALRPESAPLIEPVVRLQDHVGEMHDLHVAASEARAFLTTHAGLHDRERAAIERFASAADARADRRRARFGHTWKPLVAASYRQRLGRALARL
jgi:CHAD domain-containing protein